MAAHTARSQRIVSDAGLKMGAAAALERDAGFCSGEEEEELEDMHSPTDASEDSVEVRVRPVASAAKSKRKCAEPRRFADDAKRRLVDFSDHFRPWSHVTSGANTQEEPLSLVLRQKTPESSPDRLSPSGGPRPQDVVRLRPSATVVRAKCAVRTPSSLPLTVRPDERIARVPPVISVKPEFTDRALGVPSATLLRPQDYERISVPQPVFSTRSEQYQRIHVPYPAFSSRPEQYEAALRVPPVTSLKLEEIESIPRAPSATSVRPEEHEGALRVPFVTSASPEEHDRLRLSSLSAEERDRVPFSVREEADRVRPDECEQRAFSVESLMGDRAGPSTSKGKPPLGHSHHQQQRNYKNMTRERRIEANARERTRVHTISAAFDTLRRAVPAYSHNQKLSKLSVLRIACSYILTLSRVAGDDYSADQSRPDLTDCVENVSRTIQMEGKLRKKRDE